jgi:hypothetical protein
LEHGQSYSGKPKNCGENKKLMNRRGDIKFENFIVGLGGMPNLARKFEGYLSSLSGIGR